MLSSNCAKCAWQNTNNNFNSALTMRRLSLNQILLFCRQTGAQQVGRYTGYELCPRPLFKGSWPAKDWDKWLWAFFMDPQTPHPNPQDSGNNSEEGAERTRELRCRQLSAVPQRLRCTTKTLPAPTPVPGSDKLCKHISQTCRLPLHYTSDSLCQYRNQRVLQRQSRHLKGF